MKRPAFQFYPADWRKDPALSACSLAARGLWIELMCVAHEADQYGHLSINGKAMQTAQISRMVGESPASITKLISELEDAGVFSRDDQGCIFSRRMVADERIRNIRADAGMLGGNPNLLKQKVNQKYKQSAEQKTTPSSSSSSSSSSSFSADDTHSGSPTRAGAVCVALRAEGMTTVNPGHPDLLALLAGGAEIQDFVDAARLARERGKGFSYAVGVVKGQRGDAQRMAAESRSKPKPKEDKHDGHDVEEPA